MKRSKALVLRSLGTTAAAVALLFFVPLMIGGTIGGVVALTVKSVTDATERVASIEKKEAETNSAANPAATSPAPANSAEPDDEVINVQVGTGRGVRFTTDEPTQSTMTKRIGAVVRESLTTILMLPIQILLTSLSSIIIALLYLKTRQAGGENLNDLFALFEETEHPKKKWQERVRSRLRQSGRITSRPQ